MQTFSLTERLKALRKSAGLTQEEFAEHAQMDYKTYQHIEAGRRPSLRLCTIQKLCDAYGIELWEFFAPKLPKINVKVSKIVRSAAHNKRKSNV